MNGKIVILGSFNADLTGSGERLPAPGETVMGGSLRIGPGGKGSNQAIACHRAGGDATFIAKVGKDVFGDMARELYRSEGMSEKYLLEDAEFSTGSALIMVNEQTAQNMILVLSGANTHITHEDIEYCESQIAEADTLLLQLETNIDAIEHAVSIAHQHGVRIILNPAPARELSEALLSRIDVITPNESEAELLTGIAIHTLEDARNAALAFQHMGVKGVVITMGSRGVYAMHGDQELHLDRLTVDAVDTTGAGDAFNGGFVVALAEGKNFFDAVRIGNCTGALSVTKAGAALAMPRRAEIAALAAKAYHLNM